MSAQKKSALMKSARCAELRRKNRIRSLNTRRATEEDGGSHKVVKPKPRARERLGTPELANAEPMEKYRPRNDDDSPAHMEADYKPYLSHPIDTATTANESQLVFRGGRAPPKKRRRAAGMPAVETPLHSLQPGDFFRYARNGTGPSPDIASDEETEDPEFHDEQSRDAVLRIVVDGTEQVQGSNRRKKRTPDEMMVDDSIMSFHSQNRPEEVAGGRYQVPRMRTTLKAHQVIGAGWMRTRENKVQDNPGGILADEMGLGKTLQSLACICDGKPDAQTRKQGIKTTLIVVKKSILIQWQQEIEKHCLKEWIGKVMVYRRSKNEDEATIIALMKMYDVVLTTYEDVFRSYPFKPYPKHLKNNPDGKQKWWEGYYRQHAGPIHQIDFFRAIFDECHFVKNARGRRYESVRAVSASRRWLMSGTLITDRPKEIYAYYRIINKAYTGDFKTFQDNFLNKRVRNARERLDYSFRNFILRRTPDDRIFGEPIMRLPPAKDIHLYCTMSAFEYAVYMALVKKYKALINREIAKQKPVRHLFLW